MRPKVAIYFLCDSIVIGISVSWVTVDYSHICLLVAFI